MHLNMDMAIFIGFLMLNLFVGIGYRKEVKNIKDYALGDRNFSIRALVSTIVATWATGSSFFVILTKTYSVMAFHLYWLFVAYLSRSLLWLFFFVPKMEEFMGPLSIGEVIGKLYGKKVIVITAICGILGCVGVIAVQFRVFGNVFNYFLGLESQTAITIASSIVNKHYIYFW